MKECQNECQIETAGEAEAIVLTEEGINLTAFWTRVLSGCGTNGKFEPIFVMENVIPVIDKTFNYKIVDEHKWKYTKLLQAYYDPAGNTIVIRSDVYERALSGVPLDLVTITHELVHCVQAIVMRFLTFLQDVKFKTAKCRENSYEMQQHELQTDKITSLVMIPEALTKGKTNDEIVQAYLIKPLIQYLCGTVKSAGKSLIENLNETESIVKGVEKCAV